MNTAYEFNVNNHEVSFTNDIPISDENYKDVPVTNTYDVKLTLSQISATLNYLVNTYRRQVSINTIHGIPVDNTLVYVIGVLNRVICEVSR